jgi:hypothetical protein
MIKDVKDYYHKHKNIILHTKMRIVLIIEKALAKNIVVKQYRIAVF